MKTSSSSHRSTVPVALLCLAVALVPLVAAIAQSGGTLDLRRNVIAGGGNTSTGSGNLQISGTVGQPAAGTPTNGGTISQVGGFWYTLVPQPTPQAGAGTFAFSSAGYNVNEDCAEAFITVNRTNGNTGAVSVDFSTTNGTGYVPCNITGTPTQNCDFSYTTGTLAFATGETSKTFGVLVSKDAYIEGNETINLSISNSTGGATLGVQTAATLTVIDNSAVATNSQPMDDANIFVGQTYHDFLARQADPAGQGYWAGQITQCGADQTCINARRIEVSNAFFFELEYQQTGSYVYRLYRAAYGNNQPFPNADTSNQTEAKKVPAYAVFLPDRARVIGGASLAQSQLDFANAFVQRAAFVAKYPANLDGSSFIDALLSTIRNDIGVDLTAQKPALLTHFNSGGRGAVLYRLADDNAQTNPINNRGFIDAEYNRAFVATQYFGYLRRDSDIGGFLFWLGQVSSAPLRDTRKQHAMVCAFITSGEYQQRFSSVVTHTNGECPQ